MLNVALLSRWHPHATGYGRDFKAHPEYRVTVVWDELPDRGEQWTNELGCDFEPDYDKVLARADVDGICCTAPTNMHKELIIRRPARVSISLPKKCSRRKKRTPLKSRMCCWKPA